MPSANVIQLRQMLSEKFPGLRQHLNSKSSARSPIPPGSNEFGSGALAFEFFKGALAEIVGQNSGGATMLHELLCRAANKNQIVALIDGSDSLDVTQIAEEVLSRLLWIRCRKVADVLKAADLILRDGNLPLVLIDLQLHAEKELRKIPATTWYRFQRLVEETNAACFIFTPQPMIAPAQSRIILHSRFSIADLERDDLLRDDLLRGLEMEISDARQIAEIPEPATA